MSALERHELGPDLRERLATALTEPHLQGIEPGEVLRHVPDRRVALAAFDRRTTDAAPCVVKAYVSPRARGNDRRLRMLAGSSAAALLPESLGVSSDGHVGVVSWSPGTLLDRCSGALLVGAAEAAGAALRALHGAGVELDRAWTWADESSALTRRSPESTRGLAAAVAAVETQQDALVPSHRDFHPRQVVVDAAGVRLIDLDDAALAPAGLDVGNMLAHLWREHLVGRQDAVTARAAMEAFAGGYGALPEDLELWTVAALVRLAGLAEARHRDPEERDRLLDAVRARGWATAPRSVTVETGHVDRPVRIEEVGPGRREVVKRYVSADGAAIHQSMAELWASPFGRRREPPGLPEPLGWAARSGELRMECLSGESLGRRGEVGRSLELAEDCARLLADLHASGVRPERDRPLARLLRSTSRKAADASREGRGDDFAEVLRALTYAVGMRTRTAELVATHGDFSPRNVLLTPSGVRLIDLDRLQAAPPGRDVAYWSAWLWVTDRLSSRPTEDGWELGRTFEDAYLRASGRDRADLDLDLHRAFALVRIAHGWSSLAEDADGRRLVLAEALRQVADTVPA